MSTTNFVDGVTLSSADWFNDIDALAYEGTFPAGATSVVVTGATTLAVFNTVATTVNAFGAASVALNIGNAGAAAAFPGGVSIPTGKSLAIAGTGTLSVGGISTLGTVHASGAFETNSNGLIEYASNAEANLPFNFTGYNNGTTQFRNFKVYDGKNAEVVTFTGSSKAVTLHGHVAGTATFASGDKYLLVDASGHVHVSALGPAS